jgi:hypothetical protein
MKNTGPAIWLLAFAIALSVQSSAFDPLPPGCVNSCSNVADCMVCISACESYISAYADINAVRSSILIRQAVNTSGFDALAVYNLEKCWCSACCDYNYGGDSVHPCIYPCPCTIKNLTNNATTTTVLDKNRRPELKTSLDEITVSVNYSLCYLLNVLWVVIPGICALIIMWAGSRYLASEEDPSKRADARNIMVYALAGLVLSLAACPAVDYLIVNTDITPFSSSCKCYEAMAIKPGVPPTLPHIANVTTKPFVQTTHGVPTTIISNGTTSTKSSTTSTTSTTKPVIKLRLCFVPVNWNSGIPAFNTAADNQANFLIQNTPYKACPGSVEVLKANTSCSIPTLCSQMELVPIARCAQNQGLKNCDYIIGLGAACGNILGWSGGIGVVYVTASRSEVTVHELGHEWSLNDEYVDACKCGYGKVGGTSTNCLDKALNGNDPAPGYTSAYCTGGSCPSSYTVTCEGNKNSLGGRCLMSYGNAAKPRAFCIHCMKHLNKILKC